MTEWLIAGAVYGGILLWLNWDLVECYVEARRLLRREKQGLPYFDQE